MNTIRGLALILVCQAVVAQDSVVPIAIVSFQDDSGSNIPIELRQRLAQDLQQKFIVGYKDVLPRIMAVDEPTLERLAATARQNGARFVIRGGVLAMIPEAMVEKNGVTTQIYAEVIAADTGSVVSTVRAEGKATQAGPIELQSVATTLAFGSAIAKLADSIHRAVTTPVVATEPAPPIAEQPALAEELQPAESDAELQQLIADAESILSTGTSASTAGITAVTQALGKLQTALTEKVTSLQSGQDTARVDARIATARQALETAVAQVTAEVTAAPETPLVEVERPTAERRTLLASVDEAASQALSILEKVQQMRAALRGEPSTPTDTSAPPAEESVSEATGVVLDESGSPVAGAEVTDPGSGARAVTDSSGVYHLRGLLSDRAIDLVVRKGTSTTTARVRVPRGRAAVLDVRLKPRSAAGTASRTGILPSTVLLTSTVPTKGTVAGVVRNADGRPVAHALVTLHGLGVARTDSAGRYSFVNVPAGTRQLTVTQAGLTPRSIEVRVLAGKSNAANVQLARAAAPVITPPRVEIPRRNPQPSQTVVTSGVATRVPPPILRAPQPVRTGAITGQVLDARTRRPIAGAMISIPGKGAVSTDAAGRFRMQNLPPGTYQVGVGKTGYVSDRRAIVVRAGEDATLNLRVMPTTGGAR